MNSLTFLIILGVNGHAVTSIEFNGMEACMLAKKQVEAAIVNKNYRYATICTPKHLQGSGK